MNLRNTFLKVQQMVCNDILYISKSTINVSDYKGNVSAFITEWEMLENNDTRKKNTINHNFTNKKENQKNHPEQFY